MPLNISFSMNGLIKNMFHAGRSWGWGLPFIEKLLDHSSVQDQRKKNYCFLLKKMLESEEETLETYNICFLPPLHFLHLWKENGPYRNR